MYRTCGRSPTRSMPLLKKACHFPNERVFLTLMGMSWFGSPYHTNPEDGLRVPLSCHHGPFLSRNIEWTSLTFLLGFSIETFKRSMTRRFEIGSANPCRSTGFVEVEEGRLVAAEVNLGFGGSPVSNPHEVLWVVVGFCGSPRR